jgi:Leucine-rich repeat (LRR) protein
MGSLTHLNISHNQLRSLPAEMGKLFRLKSLSEYFSAFINVLYSFSFIDISDNPLPQDLLIKAHGASGTSSVLQHLLDKLASKWLFICILVNLLIYLHF